MRSPPRLEGAKFLDAPEDTDLALLVGLWRQKCGERVMPSRRSFDPSEFYRLLPNVFLIDVNKGSYRMRLVGDEIVQFLGHNPTGQSPMDSFTPEGSAAFLAILERVVKTRAPVFRAGSAYWSLTKQYKKFEACLLPLSADGEAVDMILGGVKFIGIPSK